MIRSHRPSRNERTATPSVVLMAASAGLQRTSIQLDPDMFGPDRDPKMCDPIYAAVVAGALIELERGRDAEGVAALGNFITVDVNFL